MMFVSPTRAQAVSYYVNCSGGNDSNAGTSSVAPLATLQRFSEIGSNQINLSAGDNLYLARGCNFTGHNMDIDWNGTAGNPITIDAYGSGALPKIWLDNADDNSALTISGSYVTIQNLYITVDQATLPHTYTACPEMAHGFFYGIRIDPPANNITIQYNTITQFSRGINMTINSSNPSVTPHHVRILHNDISYNTAAADGLIPQETMNGGKAIDLKGNDNEVAYNYMTGNSTPCTDNSGLYESNAIEVYAAKRNFIHHNVSIGQRVFSEMGGITNNLDFNTEDTVFAYNLVTYTQGPSARFIVIHGKNQTHGPTLNTRIYNNTYYAPNDNDSQAISCSGCDTEVLTMRNNIIWGRNKVLFVGPSGTTINESNNIFWNGVAGANIQNWTKDATSIVADPKFVDAANNNFRLQSDSPGIGAGSNTESLSYDFNDEDLDGISLPQGTNVDIGAYENAVSAPAFNGTTYAADTFTRTTSGWGTAETGGDWTTGATGSGSSNSVNGTEGIGTMGSCGGTTTARLDSLNVLNSDTTFKLKSNKYASGEDQNFFIINRKQVTANWEYRHRIQFNGDDIKLMAGKLLGTSTLVGISSNTTVARETYAANTFYWVRVQTYGTSPTTIRMKIWQDGTEEPSSWDVTATDSESMLQNSGAAGVRGFIPNSCTTAPVIATYDDFTIRSMSSPTISLTAQYQSDCATTLGIGAAANGTAVCLGSTVNDPDNPDTITLQAEVQPINTAFTNTANYTSAPITASGTAVNPTISIPDLTAGQSYHWQARAIDSLGNTSSWVSFGNNTENSTDFSAQTIPTVQFSPTSSSGAESTTSVSLPVTLSESTSQDVQVSYAVTGGTATGSGTDYTLASGTATITAGNTSTTIPVTIVNDTIDEDDETIEVTLSNPSNATLGSSVIYTYTITDNDTAGTSINPSSSINATEGSSTGSYTIKLNTKPLSNVTISLSVDAQVSVSSSTLTFTDSNWFTPQTVTVTAVDDAVAEGNHDGIITHTVTSADSKYNGLSMPTKTTRITDNDSPGISISESSGSSDVTEGGATDTYTVVLTTEPANNVTITVSPNAQLSVDDTSLTFTDANWDTPQTITITAVDDDVYEGDHVGTISHTASSSDANYNNFTIASVTADITDNDNPGVVVTESGDSTDVTEGGATDSYTIVLASEPANDVTITISHNTEVSLDDTSLTFTSEDWDTPQTITVTAVNDEIDEDEETSTIVHTATSSDTNYNGISIASVTTTITDNDTAGVTVTESGGSTAVTEGGTTDTFTIVLDTQPASSVVIELSTSQVTAVGPDEPEEGELSSGIVFTSANWDTPQTITVTAVDDGVAQGTRTSPISFNATSADSKYSSLVLDDVTVTITDNDTAGVTVTESGGSTAVTEGGTTDSYTIVLESEPAATVTIAVTAGSGLQVSSSSLTFTTANWETPQTVTVTAIDDSNYVGNRNVNITHAATSSDDIYDGISIDTVTVALTEDESPGVTVTQSGGSTGVTEGGATDTYTIVLDNEPTQDVTVSIAGTNGQVTLSDNSVTFTTENWDTPQTITVTAVNDDIAEGSHIATLTHTSSSTDNAFDELPIGSVNVVITDNDTAGVSITESDGTTAVAEESETSDTYTVVLTSEPTSGVTISLAGNTDVDLSTTSLSFTTGNWDTPQTVTVTANDDSVARGVYSNVITHTSSSSDSNYNGNSIASVTVVVTDNDTSGITVTQSGGTTTVSESGTTDTFTVVLDTQPSDDVVITMVSSQVTLVRQGTSSNTLTFTNSNWSTPQTVVVTAIDDSVAEGTHVRSASFGVTSDDVSYDGFAISDLSITITDNDTASVTVTQSGGTTTMVEGGSSDTYTVVLNTQPTNTVIISASPASGVTVTPTNLTFTTSNWSTPQTFTASATNNSLTDGDRNVNITHSAVSDDDLYDGISIATVTAAVTDDEIPEITISESGNATVVSENGGTDSYTIVLATQPAGNVTVTVAKNRSDITLSSTTFTFTADNWSTAQTMTVTGVNDNDAQGSRVATLTHTAASTDDNFDGLSGPNVSVTITDDDGSTSNNDSDGDGDGDGDGDDDYDDNNDSSSTNTSTTNAVTTIVTAPLRTATRIFNRANPSASSSAEQDDEPIVVPIEVSIDLDDDGDFDKFDLQILIDNWNKSLTGRNNGDLNNDGRVDLSDISIFARNW